MKDHDQAYEGSIFLVFNTNNDVLVFIKEY